MSKRYPPIFNVVLFAVAVIFMLLNPIANMIPWLPEAIKTAVAAAICALYNFFNAAGKFIVDVYSTYAIFTLHVIIIVLYGKHLFSKDVKTRYHAALKVIDDYKQNDGHNTREDYIKTNKAVDKHDGIVAKLYVLSALVLPIIITNIMCPNFYQFTISQCWGINSADTTMIGAACFGTTIIAPVFIGFIVLLALICNISKLAYVPRPNLED